ncbi:MAG: hypothetical protein ISN28_11245 [Ectothiorhodospiraceae bacterium AqS1]|nr:hypothetical protein [Ectothiorhodospiraceae bacterium AqS1]
MEDPNLGRIEDALKQLTVDVRRLDEEGRRRDEEARQRDADARQRDADARKRDEETRRRIEETRDRFHDIHVAIVEGNNKLVQSMLRMTIIVSSVVGGSAGILAAVAKASGIL